MDLKERMRIANTVGHSISTLLRMTARFRNGEMDLAHFWISFSDESDIATKRLYREYLGNIDRRKERHH